MKNTLDNFDLMDLSHDEFIAVMRFALTQAVDGRDDVNVNTTFFDEIITRMTSLKGDLDDANDRLDGLERVKDIDDADYPFEVAGEQVAALNKKEQVIDAELNGFLRQLEYDGAYIGGDIGARIREAVSLIKTIRQDPYGGSDALSIANEERLRNSCPF